MALPVERMSMSPMRQGSVVRHTMVTTLSAAVFVVCGVSGLCAAVEGPEGGELFRTYCFRCHTDGFRVRPDVPLAAILGRPPVGMPVFGKDKLTDQEAQAIEKYLWPGAAAASRTDQAPPPSPGSVNTSKGKDKKAWLRGFGTAD